VTTFVAPGLHAALITGAGAALVSVLAMRLSAEDHSTVNVGDGPADEARIIDISPDLVLGERACDAIRPGLLGDGKEERKDYSGKGA
jgi:hypothetical protein